MDENRLAFRLLRSSAYLKGLHTTLSATEDCSIENILSGILYLLPSRVQSSNMLQHSHYAKAIIHTMNEIPHSLWVAVRSRGASLFYNLTYPLDQRGKKEA